MLDEFRDINLYEVDNFNRLMGLMNYHFYRVQCDGQDFDMTDWIEIDD